MTLSFLNPALLWGLLALAVPIIIHFFNLQRPRELLFSNVAFIQLVKKTVVKRIQFQKWLLLLLRLLALTALVLAFANPVLTGDEQKSLQGNRSVVIIVDNSYSMTASNEKGVYAQQAISLARNIIRAYSRQDEFLLMTTSDLRLNYNFIEQEEALEEIKTFSTHQNIRSQADLLNFRDDLFARASNRVKEMYFLSDFQRSTVMQDSQLVSLADSNLLIKYIPLANRPQKNVYVASNQILSQILEVNKPVSLSMEIVNDGEQSVRDLSVRVTLEGKVVAINNTNLEGNQRQTLELSFTPTQSGWQSGYIELDDNPIDFDNRRYFTLYVPEKEKVLVVENQASPNLRILYESLFDQFDVQFLSSRNLSTVQLADYRSLVLLGITDISSGLADKLQTFLTEGGSVLFFPGDGLQLTSVNSFLSSVRLGQLAAPLQIQEGAKANLVDLAHPIFQGIFSRNQQNREFDAPTIFQYFPLTLNNNSVHNRIISLENQSPILVESKIGSGLMFTFALFPGDTWTDLHVKTIFTPLIFRATQIMNQTQQVQSSQEIGFFVPKSIRSQEKSLINLVDADGTATAPEQFSQGGTTMLNFEKMDIKEGSYDLVQGEKLLEKIAFNISDLESQLDFVGENELQQILQQAGYDQIQVMEPQADDLTQTIKRAQEGTPLWKYLIIFALCFLVGEILLLQWGERAVSKDR